LEGQRISRNFEQLTQLFFKQKYKHPILLKPMNEKIRQKIIEVCTQKIEKKGEQVGLSFYAFFANKNDNPRLLMEVAEWWIMTHKLDHFEKAVKIKELVKQKL